MHRLIVGCLILITILVACGGDTEEVTEADALRARLDAIEATLASSGEVPTGTPSLTTPLTLTPTPATVQAPTPRPLTSPLAPKPTASAQTAGPDAIRARQAELRAAEAAAEASLQAAARGRRRRHATRWAERQLLFDSCMDTELGEAEYAELLGFETGSSEWTNFLAIAIEGPLSYTRQGMLADHSWWRQAAGMATATPVPGPRVTPEPMAAMPTYINTPAPTAAPPTPAATVAATVAPAVAATPVSLRDTELLEEAEQRHSEAMASSILAEMRLMLLCWYVATSDV